MDIQSISNGVYCSTPLERYAEFLNLGEISLAAADQLRLLSLPRWNDVVALVEEQERRAPRAARLSEPEISAGSVGDVGIPPSVIQKLIPWRKGPFRLCGTAIDAEWRSDMKWDRLAPVLGDLSGQRVADVGCNNGYFMFRLAAHKPDLVVGFDPVERCYLQFMLAQSLIQHPALCFEPLGIEHVSLFPNFFDLVLCLGVLYHRTDPLAALEQLRAGMAPGARLILESQIIPGEEPVAFYPPERYGKAKNIYLLPTVSCLRSWMIRSGFCDIEVVSVAPTTVAEQRQTALAPYESLIDFLDPGDPTLTVEGYPAPARAVVVGRRR